MKKIKANWTFTEDSDLVTDVGEEFSKILQEEIDWEIMCDMLVHLGWHKTKYEPYVTETIAKEMKDWLKENCKGHHQFRAGTALFDNEQDLIMFKLRWL